jgi:hypothetical protein
LEEATLRLRLTLRFGMELLDLKTVVDEDDKERIEREAKWIDKQADKIAEAVQGGFVKRRDRDEYVNLMRKKFIGYAVIGLVVLLGISGAFYYRARKVLRERKLI